MTAVKTFASITPAWLTALLTQQGSLLAGQVLDIAQTRDPNPVTENATLLVTYSPGARGACPPRLFFKQSSNVAEALFYQQIAPLLAHTAAPLCYDAQADGARSHVLLAFVGPTHFAPPEAVPVALAQHALIVDALADLHVQFWDLPQRHPAVAALARDVPSFSFTVAGAHFGAFADALGDRLSPPRRAHLEQILASHPQRPLRGPLTLVHGDAHWGNFLYPHDPIAHSLFLIDWAMWHANLGVSDLAYNIALQCYPERRARVEQPLVRRYHDRLLAQGVAGYAWNQCWADYRRLVIEQCLWPVVWHHFGLSPNVWWFALECTLAAFDDLDCQELM